jgi:hypothetical protein
VLLCSDVLCTNTFWREEMAGLEQLTGRRFLETHRQIELAGGFFIWD